MTGEDHRAITISACRQLTRSCGLTGEQVDIIAKANVDSDRNQTSSAIHFDNCAFREGSLRVYQRWTNISLEADRFSATSLKAFGELLHTVQDFYAHSNWLELHAGQDPVPLWNLNPNFLPLEICSGTWPVGMPKRCRPGVPSHEEMNKERADEGLGQQAVNGKKYYTLAYETALRASLAEVKKLRAGVTAYRVTTVTGDVEDAGTDADVFIMLHNAAGVHSGRIYLDNVDQGDFERGQADSFIVGSTVNIGPLAKITIGYSLDGYFGVKPGWFLDKVIVERTNGTLHKTFCCGRWLARDEGDGKTILELC